MTPELVEQIFAALHPDKSIVRVEQSQSKPGWEAHFEDGTHDYKTGMDLLFYAQKHAPAAHAPKAITSVVDGVMLPHSQSTPNPDGWWAHGEHGVSPERVVTFSRDDDGNILALIYKDGRLAPTTHPHLTYDLGAIDSRDFSLRHGDRERNAEYIRTNLPRR